MTFEAFKVLCLFRTLTMQAVVQDSHITGWNTFNLPLHAKPKQASLPLWSPPSAGRKSSCCLKEEVALCYFQKQAACQCSNASMWRSKHLMPPKEQWYYKESVQTGKYPGNLQKLNEEHGTGLDWWSNQEFRNALRNLREQSNHCFKWLM